MTLDDDDARVPEFWRELGLPGRIDRHVHFMPPIRSRWNEADLLAQPREACWSAAARLL